MSQDNTWSRRVQAFPPPKYSTLLKAYSDYEGISESAVVVDALKQFFNSMSSQEREKMLMLYEKKSTRVSKNDY